MKNILQAAMGAALVTLATVPATVLGPMAAAAASTDPTGATCTSVTAPVTMTASDPTVYHVSGRLCRPAGTAATGVEILVSGSTYDRNYWNLDYKPKTYSYVHYAISRNYATLNLDRLGTGLSDKPAASLLTLPNHGHVLQQLVVGLRTGKVGGTAFGKVITVGHSIGAGVVQYEAGTATGQAVPDLVVLTDYLHDFDQAVVDQLAATYYPASMDPKFANAGLPADYLTTMPGTRGNNFYYLPAADPAVIALDETNKSTGTGTELGTMDATRDPAVTNAIARPTLEVIGQFDTLFCNNSGLSCANAATILRREAPNFSARACLAAYVQPKAGHDTVLHPNAPALFATAHNWLDKYLRPTSPPDANGCQA
jgi:pimeloyl-ACP methyl ester carboxylesterase